jgi:tetratricopeptide (TPR) repeat protein
VQLEPEDINAMANLGAAYLASKRYEDAELIYELIVSDNERDGGAYYHLGWSLLSQNRRDEARGAFERAVELGYQPAVQILVDYF